MRCSSGKSSSRSASPSSFSPQRGRNRTSLVKRGGRVRVRGRGRHLQLTVGNSNATSPERKQLVGKRGGRKSIGSRLGAIAKKKRYFLYLIDRIVQPF